MKKHIFIGLLVILTQFSFGFEPDDLNTVTLTNGTNVEIQYVFVKPEDAGTWGADVLGSSDTLAVNGKYSFNLLYANESDVFNFLALDEAGNGYLLSNVTVTDGTPANLRFTNRNKTPTKYDFDYTEVVLNNTLEVDINYIFLSPEETEHWGADMLDSDTVLAAGESRSLMVPVKKRAHTYNVMAVDEDNNEYTFDVDLTSDEETHEYDIEESDRDD